MSPRRPGTCSSSSILWPPRSLPRRRTGGGPWPRCAPLRGKAPVARDVRLGFGRVAFWLKTARGQRRWSFTSAQKAKAVWTLRLLQGTSGGGSAGCVVKGRPCERYSYMGHSAAYILQGHAPYNEATLNLEDPGAPPTPANRSGEISGNKGSLSRLHEWGKQFEISFEQG